ncbi:GDSL-type esterase/lipase family protein [Marinimicrobium agarilyticum]|uniref:GDSL-type esterase/lipase family protein n=1 Tax=Marinimicrobium agarilyticum TaxID=306546 RepID=UPI000418B828|nr:GDSL-type esterase/lipase family protein [Marinimicrobium agarilyticum]
MPLKYVRRLLWGLAPLTLIACQTASNSAANTMNHRFIPADSDRFALEGRAQPLDSGALHIGYPGVTLHTDFEGRYLALRAHSSGQQSYLGVTIAGQPPRVLKLKPTSQEWVLIDSDKKVSRRVEITHRGETWLSQVTLEGVTINANAALEPVKLPSRKMLLVGDSVTCSYGAGDRETPLNTAPWWDPKASYGMKVAEALDAQVHLVCYGGRGLTRSWNGNRDEGNAPEFFEWAIANKASPVEWEHTRYQPDLILVSLGTNDFSLGIGPLPEREGFVGAYVDFLVRLRAVHPGATIALTEGAIVNDEEDPERPQKTVLRQYITDAIERFGQPDVHFIPATHYPGDERDGHPTGPQHAAMAEDLSRQLGKLMDW